MSPLELFKKFIKMTPKLLVALVMAFLVARLVMMMMRTESEERYNSACMKLRDLENESIPQLNKNLRKISPAIVEKICDDLKEKVTSRCDQYTNIFYYISGVQSYCEYVSYNTAADEIEKRKKEIVNKLVDMPIG